MDASSGPGRLSEATEHGDEVVTCDMEQAGTRPDAVVGCAGVARVSEIVGQRIQLIRLEAVGAQQIHEAVGDIGASDVQPSTLELTRVAPTTATDLQDSTLPPSASTNASISRTTHSGVVAASAAYSVAEAS